MKKKIVFPFLKLYPFNGISPQIKKKLSDHTLILICCPNTKLARYCLDQDIVNKIFTRYCSVLTGLVVKWLSLLFLKQRPWYQSQARLIRIFVTFFLIAISLYLLASSLIITANITSSIYHSKLKASTGEHRFDGNLFLIITVRETPCMLLLLREGF